MLVEATADRPARELGPLEEVEREATRDWLDERDALAADERPAPAEYEPDQEDRRDA